MLAVLHWKNGRMLMEYRISELEGDVARLERQVEALKGMLCRFILNRNENEEKAYDKLYNDLSNLYRI